MKKHSFWHGVLSVLLYFFGGCAGICVWIILDINIALKDMHLLDSEKWPTMDPRNKFLFIPIFSFAAIVFGIASSAVIYSFGWKIKYWWSWLFLGFSYSILFLIFGLSRIIGLKEAFVCCVF